MTHDLDLEIVRELHPPADEHAGSEAAQARERARIALMAEIARVDSRRRRWSLYLPRLRRRRLAVLVLSGAVAVAVGLAVALSLRGGAANPSSAAAAVLQRAASAAAAGGPWQLRPGEYWYVKSYETSTSAAVLTPPCVEASASL